MTKSGQVKLIDSTYRKLYHALDPYGNQGNYTEKIYKLEREAERGHRAFAPDGYRHTITLATAAKLFVCKHLLEYYLEPQDTIEATAILDIRQAVLLACGVAKRYREAIAGAISESDARTFLDSVDYVELVRS